MKRRLLPLKSFRSLGALAAAALTTIGVMAAPKPAQAQEIQLTGPLAGAPACRHCRLYRQGRFELAIGPGFTLLDEYQRTIFAAGRLQYNVFDFLGVGIFGGFGAASLNTDLTDKIDSTAPRNSRTATNLAPKTGPGAQAFDVQTGKMKWMAAPQLTFSPFRGKLAIFQKIFTDTDLYIHGGAAFVGVEERSECKVGQCTNPASFKPESRVAIAPTFGLGLTLYASNFVSINMEYRAFPFSWNRGGFDSRGKAPDASFPDNQINSEDRTFKFNQMIFLAAGFSFPTTPKLSD
jgi:outer membrane beta-barrel protein